MSVSSRQLAEVLFSSFENLPEDKTERVLSEFLTFCRDKKLMYLLPRVLYHLERMANEKASVNSLRMIFARKQDKSIVDMVSGFIKAKPDTVVSIDIDEDLIGGFVVLYQNIIFDGSIKRQLNRAENILIG